MNSAFSRIQKDLKEVNYFTDFDTPPIFCKPVNDSLDHISALVIGPPDTPYEFGFFRFDMKFGPTYPDKPPRVLFVPNDGGKTRLNPNLYAQGKVCLSILGTWTGESVDEWRSIYSIHYILRAIQSLIMTQKPYHNEPGYEELNSQYSKSEDVQLYSDKVTHEVIRLAVCLALEDCLSGKRENPFVDIMKHYFLLYYDVYVRKINEGLLSKDGTEFQMMPFEYSENGAYGRFNYKSLLIRLQEIKGKLEKETQCWKEKTHGLIKAEAGWKYFKLLEEYDKIRKRVVNLEGISAGPVTEDNLFFWNASIFGAVGTVWEGGIYNLELVFNESDAPPRVKFLMEMWHPHITKDGIPFYFLDSNTRDPLIPVLLAVQKLLQTTPNSSSATWVNADAAKQYFSKSEDMRKEYRRRAIQCARKSMES